MFVRSQPLATWPAAVLLAALTACSSPPPASSGWGTGGVDGGTIDASSSDGDGADDDSATHAGPSEADATPAEDVSAPSPKVTLLSLQSAGPAPAGILCAGTVTLTVEAHDLGDRLLRIALTDGHTVAVLDSDPTPTGDDGRYTFSLDLAPLVQPTDDSEPAPGQILLDGKPVTLMAAAFVPTEAGQPGDLPTGDAVDERALITDALPPELTLDTPELTGPLPTLAGLVRFAGHTEDSAENTVTVSARIDGETLAEATIPSSESAFDVTADLRLTGGRDGTLTVRAVDGCGLTSTVEADIRIVGWPWLRSHQNTAPITATGSEQIHDTAIVDLDADTWPDVLVGAKDGIWLAPNGGPDAPGELLAFRWLAAGPALAVSPIDLDSDELLDFVVVDRVGGVERMAAWRQIPGGAFVLVEARPVLDDATVVDLAVADLDADGRDDVVVVTTSASTGLQIFRRRGDTPSEAFDQCSVLAGDEAPVACPDLFTDPVAAGGVSDATHIELVDVTGADGVADGYPDVLVGADGKDHLHVFRNRFDESELVDTPLAAGIANRVWPGTGSNQHVRYFCTADLVEDPPTPDNHLDVVVGTESSGTWRVLAGTGHGQYRDTAPPNGQLGDLDVWSMSGTLNSDVGGVACGDLDGDGHQDFVALTRSENLLQVHLGDGAGRFNQLDDALQNPANEGVGFVTPAGATRPRLVDLDKDGRLDLLLDTGDDRLFIYRNVSDEERGFDLAATRALLTPLGKSTTSGDAGELHDFAIGDMDGDGRLEIVAASDGSSIKEAAWLWDHHPTAAAYRGWATPGKTQASPTLFVWGFGTYGKEAPSWPAAYDRLPRVLYGGMAPALGSNDPDALMLVDMATPGGSGYSPDGVLDIVTVGTPRTSNPKTFASLYVTRGEGTAFWDAATLADDSLGMFEPYNGSLAAFMGQPRSGTLVPDSAGVPALVTAANTHVDAVCGTVPGQLRYCPWRPPSPGDVGAAFWRCDPFPCGQPELPVADNVVAFARLAAAGPFEGMPSAQAEAPAHVLSLSAATGALGSFARATTDEIEHAPMTWVNEVSLGETPVDLATGDIDGDGYTDLAVTVKKNVHLAFAAGDDLVYEAPLALDGPTQDGTPASVALSDVNADGLEDILFTRATGDSLAVYLAVGLQAGNYLRAYHHAMDLPLCNGPGHIETADFNGDGCETIAVMCGGAGAIALVGNDTCKVLAGD